jgi:hypothetical protein
MIGKYLSVGNPYSESFSLVSGLFGLLIVGGLN